MKSLKSQIAVLILPLAILVAMTACTPEGFDGDGRISGKVAHHGARIAEATVYIKFGAKELPGTLVSDFDASVVADTGGNYIIENLKKGDYYLFGFGYDSTFSRVVTGGLSVTLKKGQDLTVEVAVTE